MKLVIGITGASGSIFGVRILELLKETSIETHLVMSKWGARTLVHETPYTPEHVKSLATCTYSESDQSAAISSGSFITAGMIVAPCSVRTLAAIAHGHGDNLIHRAADVVLKERRKLVLMVREAPLSDIHLENMLKLSRMGVVIIPPMPAFYDHPQTIDEMVNHIVMRALDQFGIHLDAASRWDGVTTQKPDRT
ncbi:MAG: UbiX family flavin prenyltransferase [Acidobacteria bacterium]|nr:UbiX family flavin prenyltransferase [Acidobacteriota bacterium]